MSTIVEFEAFCRQLSAMPHQELVDAVAAYAASDYHFLEHMQARVLLLTADARTSLKAVIRQIDQVYGNDDMPDCLEFADRSKFSHVQELIEELLKRNSATEAVQACRHAFTYVENIASVNWPDDFVFQAYDSIIKTWMRGLRATGLSGKEIAETVFAAKCDDDYGMFGNIEEDYAAELGPEALSYFQAKCTGCA